MSALCGPVKETLLLAEPLRSDFAVGPLHVDFLCRTCWVDLVVAEAIDPGIEIDSIVQIVRASVFYFYYLVLIVRASQGDAAAGGALEVRLDPSV